MDYAQGVQEYSVCTLDVAVDLATISRKCEQQ